MILHILPNAHLDPVWLWDWREGLNEGLVTMRTILDLMDEYPRLTFMRGEAAIYEHIEQTDRRTFKRIERMIEKGRWEVVGGTYIQPDSNLPSTETLCRQFERGLAYFESRFEKRPTVAWQADSFGHTPGWPNILRSLGMDGFAFTRPQRTEFPLESPAFWWETDYGDRLLCYRQHWKWYCSERFNLVKTLDLTIREAAAHPFQNVGLLMGLGNHGGGPTRRHLAEVEEWAAAHPQVDVRFSTLHGLFEALRSEISANEAEPIPNVRGDLGYALRGCYSSVAKLKYPYRKTEALLTSAETTQSIIATTLRQPGEPLSEAWDSILFNAFHDILPGSSIERPFDDQLAWLGLAWHQARATQLRALNQLAAEVDTSVPPPKNPDDPTDVSILVWNPLPRAVKGWFELEASLDYRPFRGAPAVIGLLPLFLESGDGKKPRFQEIATEHTSMREMAWRKRVAVYDELPPLGWTVYRFGARQDSKPGRQSAPNEFKLKTKPPRAIANGSWSVAVTNGGEVRLRCGDQNLLGDSGALQGTAPGRSVGLRGRNGRGEGVVLLGNDPRRMESHTR